MVWFLIFVIWPLAELFVIIKVSEAIGVPLVLLALIATWPVGTRIIKAQGRRAWRQFVEAAQSGRAPAHEAFNGALVLLGGLLLLVPGFITDLIGLLLLIPVTRSLVHRALARHHASAWITRAAGLGWASRRAGSRWRAGRQAPASGPSRRDYDVDSTAVDVDDPELRP